MTVTMKEKVGEGRVFALGVHEGWTKKCVRSPTFIHSLTHPLFIPHFDFPDSVIFPTTRPGSTLKELVH